MKQQRRPRMTHKPHFILLGGFLGAGKTTAAAGLAQYLAEQGLRAGFITNDQGDGLVDTAALQHCGWPTEEIAGGCFCCRFDALLGAAHRLSRREPPDVLIAEAVGSCTDLAATVAYPLRWLHGDHYTVAPLSILIDPIQARRILGLELHCNFSAEVRYLFQKQLEEADLLVVNKSDLVEEGDLENLRARLAADFPQAEVLIVSSREGLDLEPWFRRMVFGRQIPRLAMELDYDRYAHGEACLGWLNASVTVDADVPFDPDAFLLQLAAEIQTRLDAGDQAEIAHLKLLLQDETVLGRTAVVNLVRSDSIPESSSRLDRRILTGRMLVNLRAQASPETLKDVLKESVSAIERLPAAARMRLKRLEAFRPAAPLPTYGRTGGAGRCRLNGRWPEPYP